ncbi:TonB-dependent receptor [Massilia sp. DD77]|uniref:TonB-dependent receptor n=1 Tax=Massilia sp. DD77 TaxID=3109349 RepID=UPI002FFF8C61
MQARSSALAIALAMSASCHAAGPEPVAVVKVTGHYDNAVGSSDAASEGTINADLIVNRPALRTSEILEFVPGLIVTQHSGDGKANQYFLRGFNLDHGTDFATYVDGMPVNMRTHAHGQGYTDLNFLIPELVQRIAYRKGPYFAEEGDFASAGAARIHLLDRMEEGHATLTVGRNGYRRAVLADARQLKGGALLYAVEGLGNDGPWAVAERLRQYKGLLRYSAGNAEDGYKITAMGYRNRWNATDQVPLRAVRNKVLDRFGTIDASDGGETSRYSLAYALRKPAGEGRLSLEAYLMRSTLDLYSNFTYFLKNPENGDQFNQSERRRMAGVNGRYQWNARPGGFSIQNTVGIQSRGDWLDPVALYSSNARKRSDLVREDKVREMSAGMYLESAIRWQPWLRTVAGLRHDRYRFDVASSIEGNSGRRHDTITLPKLSLVAGPWRDTEFFINGGRGFHSNDARGTTQTRLNDGTPSLPVTPLVPTRGAELGLRSEPIRGLQSSLALWQLDIASELVFVGDAGETQASRASRRDGIEWNNHYVVRPWLLLDLDLALSRARYRDLDPARQFIPGSLNRVGSFGITVTEWRNWFGNLTIRYFGPRPLVEDKSVQSASTAMVYGRLGYRLGRNVRLTLDVFNLLDRKASDIDYFYVSRLEGEASGGQEDVHFHPVEPRTARLTLSYTF